MVKPERSERLQFMLSEDELAAINNWRFTRRMPSRAAAVRDLLRRGIAIEDFGRTERHIPAQRPLAELTDDEALPQNSPAPRAIFRLGVRLSAKYLAR